MILWIITRLAEKQNDLKSINITKTSIQEVNGL